MKLNALFEGFSKQIHITDSESSDVESSLVSQKTEDKLIISDHKIFEKLLRKELCNPKLDFEFEIIDCGDDFDLCDTKYSDCDHSFQILKLKNRQSLTTVEVIQDVIQNYFHGNPTMDLIFINSDKIIEYLSNNDIEPVYDYDNKYMNLFYPMSRHFINIMKKYFIEEYNARI